MSRKLFVLMVSFVLLTALTGSALAYIDIVWTNGFGDGLWDTAANWEPAVVPSTVDHKAKVVRLAPNDAHITDGMDLTCLYLVVGDNVSGEMHVTGGSLTVAPPPSGTWAIVAYAAKDVGIITMDGGTINTGDRLFIGFQGNGTLNMNGGTINVGGTFGIGYGEGYTTGRGYVYLNGGTINVGTTITPTGGSTGSGLMMSTPVGQIGKLDIAGGTLVLAGNRVAQVTGYINNGYITAYNTLGDVIVDFNNTNPDKTTVTAVTNTTRARGPYPSNMATNVAPYAVLTWTAGDGVATHDVYFGTDATSVLDANTENPLGVYQGSQPGEETSFEPTGLEFGKTYYWRVDEVNEPNNNKGNLWRFQVANYSLIDNFEKYADTDALLLSWSYTGTGGTLSLATTGGHDQSRTMKFDYNNVDSPFYSEAQTAGPTTDWTIQGVVAMDIWYKGDANNADEPMYAALEDNDSHPVAILVNGDPNVKSSDWQVWHIELSDFTGVNLANVKKFYIGFGDRTSPATGGAGTVYFDDIKLYRSRCLYKPWEDLNDDCVVDFKDFDIMANSWLANSRI